MLEKLQITFFIRNKLKYFRVLNIMLFVLFVACQGEYHRQKNNIGVYQLAQKPVSKDTEKWNDSVRLDTSIQNFNAHVMDVDPQEVYRTHCSHCHGASGEGLSKIFPPLQNVDILENNPMFVVSSIIKGLSQPVVVNGVVYEGVMPAQNVKDENIYAILKYIYGPLGNQGEVPSMNEIKSYIKSLK